MGNVVEFGSWTTPLTAAVTAEAEVRLAAVHSNGPDTVIWAESRPAEGGRTQLVARTGDGSTTDLLPNGFDARTAVHEYGGGDWWVRDGVVWFANWADQRLYRFAPGAEPSTPPTPLTPEPESPRGDRYADGDLTFDGSAMVVVRERHSVDGHGAEVVCNELVLLSADQPSVPEVVMSGPDFVSSPRFSPDGTSLAFLSWDHPSMPWNDTTLTVRNLKTDSDIIVAAGPSESVSEPRWASDGTLYFISDRSGGWWNLYRWRPGTGVEPVIRVEAEIGEPAWQFGGGRYAVLTDGRIFFARSSGGFDGLALRTIDGGVTDLDLPFTVIHSVRSAGPDSVVLIGGTPSRPDGVYQVFADGRVVGLNEPDAAIDAAFVSVPEAITFPSADADGRPRIAHGLFYPPANADFVGPENALPPLIVMIHGGPTSRATPRLSLGVQFWTTRGFAVVDVNYGGSVGYGRAYREQLRGTWGVIDVADCVAAARWLTDQRRVDGARLLIRGGSAGGFTTLAALARADSPFAAGADYYGIADLEILAQDTHKFESRYLDWLIGPYPQQRDRYSERSPIQHIDEFSRPLIVFQGSKDEVVPPNQSEMIVSALRERGVPVAYVLFPDEQHGFRKAHNIRRSLEAELSFYAQLFAFPLPESEDIEPLSIENL